MYSLNKNMLIINEMLNSYFSIELSTSRDGILACRSLLDTAAHNFDQVSLVNIVKTLI